MLNEMMFSNHASRLVMLSILIWIVAAFAARELVGRIRLHERPSRRNPNPKRLQKCKLIQTAAPRISIVLLE
jgi:hypothetical protein